MDFLLSLFGLDHLFLVEALLIKLMILLIPPFSIDSLAPLKGLVQANHVHVCHLSEIFAVVDPDTIVGISSCFKQPKTDDNTQLKSLGQPYY